MKVVFRADGGGAIGWGHLGRCAALAEVLDDAGVEVAWACRAAPAVEKLTGAPPSLVLPGEPTMDTLPSSEAETLAAFAADADWIFVDHYGADDRYLDTLRSKAGHTRVLVFDDHQVRRAADLRLAPTQQEGPDTLAGAAYQPVHPCFSSVGTTTPRQGWLLALGGADPHDDTAACVAALGDGPELWVLASDAIAARQDLDGLLSTRATPGQRLAWLSPPDLARRLSSCEAALVSSSTLSWEALATGTPIVALQTADNQDGVVRTLSEAGIPVFDEAAAAADALSRGLASQGDTGARLDGLGAWRVARAMGVEASWPEAIDPSSGSAP